MSKRGPLSIAEKFYIVKNPNNLTIEQLANELGRTVKTVEKTISEGKKPEEVKKDTGCIAEIKAEGKTRQLMGRESAGHRKGITIMTAAASEHADDTRKHRLNKDKKDRPERYSDAGISKIFPDED